MSDKEIITSANQFVVEIPINIQALIIKALLSNKFVEFEYSTNDDLGGDWSKIMVDG